MERLEKVDTLIVDKTGTLTEGKPRLTRVVAADSISEEQLLSLAASVEQQSEHPLAASIARGAQERHVTLATVTDFQSTTGGGVIGKADGHEVLVGKPQFMRAQNVIESSHLKRRQGSFKNRGKR